MIKWIVKHRLFVYPISAALIVGLSTWCYNAVEWGIKVSRDTEVERVELHNQGQDIAEIKNLVLQINARTSSWDARIARTEATTEQHEIRIHNLEVQNNANKK